MLFRSYEKFTQQAKNLATSNAILLLDGEALVNFSYDDNGIPFFDDFMNQISVPPRTQTSEEWVMNDLVARYGISSQKIVKDCLSRGLPYFKVGREYHFTPDAVKKWEIQQQFIPIGHKGTMELPVFRSFRLKLIHAYRDAKQQGNKAKAYELKQAMRKHGIRDGSRVGSTLVTVVGWLLFILILLWATGQIS